MSNTRSNCGAAKVMKASTPLKEALCEFASQNRAFPINTTPCPECCIGKNITHCIPLPSILFCDNHIYVGRLNSDNDNQYNNRIFKHTDAIEEKWVPKVIEWLAEGPVAVSSPILLPEERKVLDTICKYAGWSDGLDELITITQAVHGGVS